MNINGPPKRKVKWKDKSIVEEFVEQVAVDHTHFPCNIFVGKYLQLQGEDTLSSSFPLFFQCSCFPFLSCLPVLMMPLWRPIRTDE